MKEDICTIPVNEVFAKHSGCPVCLMRDDLENRALEFVMGAAMMETDVRHETNSLGFCPDHFDKMCGMKNRLSLALMLESHLIESENSVFEKCKPGVLKSPAKSAEESVNAADGIIRSCYVCGRVERSLDKVLDTFFAMWKKDESFRKDVASQEFYCLPHYALLVNKGRRVLDKKSFAEFLSAVTGVTRTHLQKLREDMTGFCKMYDYHNNGADFGNLRNAIKNADSFLTGRASV